MTLSDAQREALLDACDRAGIEGAVVADGAPGEFHVMHDRIDPERLDEPREELEDIVPGYRWDAFDTETTYFTRSPK